VGLTAPYLHDGSVESLYESIQLMGRHQLGRELPDADIRLLEAFLHTPHGQAAGRQQDRQQVAIGARAKRPRRTHIRITIHAHPRTQGLASARR
jgi:cytochrome c peroxidase